MVKSFTIVLLIVFICSFQAVNAQDEQPEFLVGAAENFTCQVENCLACQQGQGTVCAQCDGALIFSGGACVCPDGLFVVNEVDCVGCIANCLQCSDATTCDVCFQQYYLDPTTQTCFPCPSNCLSCTGPAACDLCQQGYVLNNGVCQILPTSVDAVIVDGDQVIQCPPGCSGCSTPTICTTCIIGYFFNSDTCTICDVGCLTCDGPTATDCLSCPSGFLLEAGACVTCADELCIQCSPSTFCTLCVLGFTPINGVCIDCQLNCVSCSVSTNCLTCSVGQILFGGQCIECIIGCGICNQTNFTQCLQCNEGYYSSASLCLVCPIECQLCTNETTCQACINGYQLIDDFCYPACIHPCYQCVRGQPNTCTNCFSGYVLSGTECLIDTTCNGTSTCVACGRRYFLSGGKCLDCNTQDPQCVKCDAINSTKCIQCQFGYYLDQNDCIACPSECTDCSNQFYCSGCVDGYYLVFIEGDNQGQCQLCSAEYFCQTCVDFSTQCLSCLPGYTLISTKCISDVNVQAVVVLDTTIQEFLGKINAFKIAITDQMGAPYAGNPHYITFNQVNPGSIILNATFTVPEDITPQSVQSTLTVLLVQNATYGGVTIASSEINIPTQEQQQEQQQQEDPDQVQINLGLVLGLSIPLLLILLSLILIIKSKSGKDIDQQQEDVIQSNQKFSEKI